MFFSRTGLARSFSGRSPHVVVSVGGEGLGGSVLPKVYGTVRYGRYAPTEPKVYGVHFHLLQCG